MTGSPSAPTVGFDWDAPRFSSVRACSAIHCNTQWLTDLISGSPVKYPLGEDEIIELAQRRRFLFKFRTVFHLALIRRIGTALPLVWARDLSRICASSDFLFSPDGSPGGPPRYLVITPASFESKMLVRSVDGPQLVLEDLVGVGDNPLEVRVVLNATEVFDRVVEALDILEVAGEQIG